MSATAILLLAGALSACAPASTAPATGGDGAAASTEPTASDAGAQAPQSGGSGDYAFGVDRAEIAVSIEAAFSSKNGTARWEGDTLVLSVDGDASAMMAGFTECRVLLELLLEDDVSVIEFPNGQVACADVLAN